MRFQTASCDVLHPWRDRRAAVAAVRRLIPARRAAPGSGIGPAAVLAGLGGSAAEPVTRTGNTGQPTDPGSAEEPESE